MSHFYGRTAIEDRDLSRAAAERYFVLQAVAERKASSASATELPLASPRRRWAWRPRFTLGRAG
jgi:hypothetical protein